MNLIGLKIIGSFGLTQTRIALKIKMESLKNWIITIGKSTKNYKIMKQIKYYSLDYNEVG